MMQAGVCPKKINSDLIVLPFVGMGKKSYWYLLCNNGACFKNMERKLHYPEFSNQCISVAENIYSIRNKVADVDSSGSGQYLDKNFEGKLALGAIELYMTTFKASYLNDATTYADSANSDFWWSWGNINSLRISDWQNSYPRSADYIKIILKCLINIKTIIFLVKELI